MAPFYHINMKRYESKLLKQQQQCLKAIFLYPNMNLENDRLDTKSMYVCEKKQNRYDMCMCVAVAK